MCSGFVAILKSPSGQEATKGPHSDARSYEAHHAAGAAARAQRDKTDADEDTSNGERQTNARTCDDAHDHANDRRPTMAGVPW